MLRLFLALLLCLASPLLAQDSPDPWPKTAQVAGTTFTMYQPQLEKWDGATFVGHAAVAVQPSGAEQPTYGAMNLRASTQVNRVTRTVHFDDLTITRVNFPSAPDQATTYQQALQGLLQSKEAVLPLDRLESELAIQNAQTQARAVPVQNPVPAIVFATQPTVLVTVQGQPTWGRVTATTLQRLINTRALVLKDSSGTVYVHILDGFLQAPGLSGPWTVSTQPPAEAAPTAQKLAASGVVDLLQAPADSTNAPTLSSHPPQVLVATSPTELIVTQGPAQWQPLDGTNLLFVSNSTGNVFKCLTDQQTYVLVTGRWFRGPGLAGPWQYLDATLLPADFEGIPDDSPKENVKACIPGTVQAQEALIANQIPHTATVTPAQTSFIPQFDGTPTVVPVQGTSLSYVANSPTPILVLQTGQVYACSNGVWFQAATVNGPYTVARSVPAVIYTIPTSSPLHYVTYVKVYDADTGQVVVGYTPGYMGSAVDSDGVVVYGTGYDYDPYVTGQVWYPVPATYGYAANMAWAPGTGWAFAMGMGWGIAAANWYDWGWGTMPYWGPWGYHYWDHGVYVGARGAAYWGPGGWASTTGNVYSRWGNTGVVTRESAGYNAWTGNQWNTHVGASYNSTTGRISAGHSGTVQNVYSGDWASGARGATYNPNSGRVTTAGAATGSRGNTIAGGTTYNPRTGSGTGVVDVNNNVYADHNGNVYRNTDNGWEHYNNGSWNDVNRPDLNAKAQARGWGEQRTGSFGNIGGYGDRSGFGRSSGFSGRAGGFGGFGGFGRGGGRR